MNNSSSLLRAFITCPRYQLLHTNLDIAFSDKNGHYRVRSINGDDECRLGKKLCVDVTLRSCNLSLLYYNCVYYYRCVAHKPRSPTIILDCSQILQKKKKNKRLAFLPIRNLIVWTIIADTPYKNGNFFFFVSSIDFAWKRFFSHRAASTRETRILCAYQHYTFESYYTR